MRGCLRGRRRATMMRGSNRHGGFSYMLPPLPPSWQPVVGDARRRPYFARLEQFLADERQAHTVYPPEHLTFRALELTPFERVNVALLAQDPYHGPGQAHGLCFSVTPESKAPPSLVNIFRELKS